MKAALASGVLLVVVAGAFLLSELFDDDSEPTANQPENVGTAGEVPNPLGSTPPPPTSNEEAAPATTGPAASSNPSDEATAGTGPLPDEIVLSSPEMVLIRGFAWAAGLGTPALFGYYPEGITSREEWKEACEEREKLEGEEAARRCRELADENVLEAVDASCAFIAPFVVRGLSTDTPLVTFDPEGFVASFRTNQFNHISIGVSGGITTGGYSFGADGRGNSEQWPLQGGTFRMISPSYREVKDAPDEFGAFFHWSGSSVENYTGEEATGEVGIVCEWAVND